MTVEVQVHSASFSVAKSPMAGVSSLPRNRSCEFDQSPTNMTHARRGSAPCLTNISPLATSQLAASPLSMSSPLATSPLCESKTRSSPTLSSDSTRSLLRQDGASEERKGRRGSVRFEVDSNPPSPPSQTPEKAVRFVFNNEREKWCKSSCKVHFNETPISTTQKSATYRMVDALTGEEKICTLFPPNTPEETYFDDAMIQHLAQEYAQLFNEISDYPVKFVPKDVYKLSERQNFLVSVHPKLSGDLAPNEELVLTESESDIMEAFSHFTWEASHGNLVITSMNGYGGVYTSARIHSTEQQWLKDRGTEGIVRFFKKHCCNKFCKMHKFRPFKLPEQVKEAAAAERKADVVKPPPMLPEEECKVEPQRRKNSWLDKMDQPPPLSEPGVEKSPVNTSSRPSKKQLIPDSPETHALKTDATLQDLNSLTQGLRNQLGVKPPKMQQEQPGSKSPKYSGLLVSKGVPGGVLKITKAGMKSLDRERKNSPLRRQI